MSADGTSSARKPDVPVTAAGQGADASATAGAKGQHDATAREPATGILRRDHADAILAGTPGRPRHAADGSATPEHQQAGKAGQAPPDHGEPGKDASTTAGAKRQDGTHPREPATGILRGDHADAILAGTPGHPREAPTTSTAPDHQHAAKPGQAPPDHGEPPNGADTETRAKGKDGPGPVGAAGYCPDGEPGTTSANGTDASERQRASPVASDLQTAEQPVGRRASLPAIVENSAPNQDGRKGGGEPGGDGSVPAEPQMGQPDVGNRGPDDASMADGQPDQSRDDLAPADAGGPTDDAGQPPVASDDPPPPQGPAPEAASDARDQVIQARDATIASRDATIAQRDRTIDGLREASEGKDRQIAELQQALADRNDLAGEQRQELSARDAENEKLKSENADLKMEIWRLEDEPKRPEAQHVPGIAHRDIPPSQEAERQAKPEQRRWQRMPSDTTATAVVGYTGVAAAIATAANYINGVEAGITTAVAAAIGATIGVVNERRKKGKNDS